MTKKLLLIGKPDSSKTVFITQFYIRLQKGKSKLTLYEPVSDLSAISDAKDSLAKGEEPEPTDPGRSVGLILPLQFNEHKVDLYCPDYGGEQINNIISNRQLSKEWASAITDSENWIFFVRLNSINRKLDLTNVKKTEHHTIGQNTSVPFFISEQSSLIELLQVFLQFKKHNFHKKNVDIKLTIVMTCWDELNTHENPKAVLKEHLPLLLQFIESNLDDNCARFIGLSALGFNLSKSENKERYALEGSENFGFLVNEDGTTTTDITELIAKGF